MQVNDSQAAAANGPTAKDEVRSVGDGPPRGDGAGSGKRFREALARGRRGSTDGGGAQEVASAAAMAGWFRPESPALSASAPGKAAGPAAVTGARVVDRVLIGSGPEGAQARIRIGAGALAGTEIQLSGGAGGQIVEARLLTHAATSRQTLSVVMDEIRSRLRDRGIALSVRPAGGRGPAPEREVDGGGADDVPPPSSGAPAGKR